MSVVQPKEMQSIVNMDFLRSGAEFSPTQTRKRMNDGTGARKSRNARLEEFYNSTLAAATNDMKSKTDTSAAASLDAWDGLSMHTNMESALSIVNLDFLRSGNEFKSNGNDMSDNDDFATAEERRMSRNAKLESFYNATLAAAANTRTHGSSGADMLDCWDGMPCATTTHTSAHTDAMMDVDTPTTADSVVNMDFLRSGLEFKPTPDDGMHAHDMREYTLRTRNTRLDDFYARTLAVHQM